MIALPSIWIFCPEAFIRKILIFAGNLCPEILVPWPGMLGSVTFCIWLIPHHGAYRLQWGLSDGHITLVEFLSQLIFLWWNPLISQGVLQVFRTPGNLHLFTFFFLRASLNFFARGLRSCIIWSLYPRPENIFLADTNQTTII